MIKSLQKRISTLFMFLLTIIWLVILLLFVNNSYRNNLSDLEQVRIIKVTDMAPEAIITKPTF